MLKKLLKKQAFRYLICGGVTAVFNVLLTSIMIDFFGLNTPTLRNIANIISIEISLIFSFFVYKIWVWPGGSWAIKRVFLYQIPLYHISAGIYVIARSLIIFPILDWLGVNYSLNTLIGIIIGAILNYKISDKLVFRTK